MIEQLSGFPDNVVAFACHGHVTRDEYREVVIPRIEEALAAHDSVRLYYEVGDDFTGIEPGAVWQDTKIGIEHWTRWSRVAVVTDVAWIGHTIQAFGFLMPAEVRIFARAGADEARGWIVAD